MYPSKRRGMAQFSGLLSRPATARLRLRCATMDMVQCTKALNGDWSRGTKALSRLLSCLSQTLFECTVRDFSPAGAGLLAPDAAIRRRAAKTLLYEDVRRGTNPTLEPARRRRKISRSRAEGCRSAGGVIPFAAHHRLKALRR
jgi:hypothetical protein